MSITASYCASAVTDAMHDDMLSSEQQHPWVLSYFLYIMYKILVIALSYAMWHVYTKCSITLVMLHHNNELYIIRMYYMYYIGIGLSWMCIIYIMYIHITPAAYKCAVELGNGYNTLLSLFECIMYKKVRPLGPTAPCNLPIDPFKNCAIASGSATVGKRIRKHWLPRFYAVFQD